MIMQSKAKQTIEVAFDKPSKRTRYHKNNIAGRQGVEIRNQEQGSRKQLMWQLIENVYSSYKNHPTHSVVIEYLLDDSINYLRIIASAVTTTGKEASGISVARLRHEPV